MSWEDFSHSQKRNNTPSPAAPRHVAMDSIITQVSREDEQLNAFANEKGKRAYKKGKKNQLFDKYLGESSLRCCSVLHLVCQGWRTSASSTISPHSSSSRAPALRLSHFTQFIFLLTTLFFYAARDIRCVLGILAILKSSQAHTEKKSWENINIVMRAYRLALARSHLISRSPHISILSWACRDDDDFGVCKLFSYIFRALI